MKICHILPTASYDKRNTCKVIQVIMKINSEKSYVNNIWKGYCHTGVKYLLLSLQNAFLKLT